MSNTYSYIKNKKQNNEKLFAILIDPDSLGTTNFNLLLQNISNFPPDIIFVGGSITSKDIDKTIIEIKKNTNIPIVLFPGNVLQISKHADALLFISLISGRNPEYLIGHHVIAAPFIKQTNLEVIPTGYILIETNKTTSVEYMSNTKGIPAEKTDIIIATAIAGEMLGQKLIYLEAGSGANNAVHENVIQEVKKNISVPIIVGGGISNIDICTKILDAGADIVVIGTAIEKNPDKLKDFYNVIKSYFTNS